eukprot:2262176-Pyramimonas_sp.AAC.1
MSVWSPHTLLACAGILHLDELRVYNSRIKALQLDSQTTKSPFGVGLLVGAAAVRHGYDTGCRKAELLAINDNTQYVARNPINTYDSPKHSSSCIRVYTR